MHRNFLAIIVIAVLTGCSSTPLEPGAENRVPTDRVYGYQAEVPEGAILLITRDKGFWASGGCLASVLLDGKKVARIDTGEALKLNVKPGRYIVGISGDDEGGGLCALQIGQPVKETATEIRSGEIQKFRISGTQNGTDIRPSSI